MASFLGDLLVTRVSCLLGDVRVPREPTFPPVEGQKRGGPGGFQKNILYEHWQGSRHISGNENTKSRRNNLDQCMIIIGNRLIRVATC